MSRGMQGPAVLRAFYPPAHLQFSIQGHLRVAIFRFAIVATLFGDSGADTYYSMYTKIRCRLWNSLASQINHDFEKLGYTTRMRLRM